jgi:lipoprotein-anchoring transpeptidase ErfK/SrfK
MKSWALSIGSFFIVFLISLFITVNNTNDSNNSCANSISCIKNLTGIYDKQSANAEFQGKFVFAPYEMAGAPLATNVLGDSTANKRIEVDLTNQRLYAYEGDRKVYDFLVSTGKWGRTPAGTFDIWIKLRYTKMEGGNKELGTYYYLPNVPFVMFFYNDQIPKYRGFGIHGAYWHSNFGHPMSHGCINMKIEEAEQLYYWANPSSTKHTTYATADNPGTKIIIYGVAPNE